MAHLLAIKVTHVRYLFEIQVGMVGVSKAWQSDVINSWPFLVHISALVILQKEFFSLLLDWFDCQVFMYPPLYYGCCTHTDWVWMSIWESSVLAFIKVSLRRSIQPARPVDQTLNHLRHTHNLWLSQGQLLSTKMVDWNDLGKCSNPRCPDEGSCSSFYPVTGEEYVNPLPQKCLCGCRGNQHLRLGVPTTANTPELPSENGPSAPTPSSVPVGIFIWLMYTSI